MCPEELFDDLVRLGHLITGKRVVEVGAGTGQATLPLARRGLAIDGTLSGTVSRPSWDRTRPGQPGIAPVGEVAREG